MPECQEPRCNAEGTKVWGGRKVCQDHYDQYRDQQDRMIAEMREH